MNTKKSPKEAKNVSEEKNLKNLQKISEELLSQMSTKAIVEVSFDKENEAFVVNIEGGEETGLLIGKKGETLTSIQTILGILLKQKTGEWSRVVVNVGDYREKEEDYLKNLALTTAERAKETKEPQSLYNLTAGQRRIVHMTLSEDEDIETESMGDGGERY
ncbi:MAG TPA: R3H domain-containing nucleic acid-binding protein, partial [Patescibacteria group bacterium]|nr:R3H domain-containing nucleic acid-binding protein [Patescibacteria group bacterium]